jgi:hypothetical protein
MFEEREVITLLLGVGVVIFVIRQRDVLRSVQNWPMLCLAFLLLFASLAASVIEVMIWEKVVNWLQHLCSSLSAIALAIWCWLTFVRRDPAT